MRIRKATYSSYREYLADDDVELVEKGEILQLFGKRPATQIKRFTEFVNDRKSRSVYEPDKLVRNFPYGDGIIGNDEFGEEIDARMRSKGPIEGHKRNTPRV